MAASVNEKAADERRKQVMVGDLPEDFLRLSKSPSQQQISADEEAALMLQQQISYGNFLPSNAVARLQITIVEAKLVKNYGMTRMDPYLRLRVGHMIYETDTSPNGAKNPKWNKVVVSYLPQGVNTISVEIFKECAFTMDEKIAWTQITIPENVLTKNETHEDWYPLTGKQGDEKEGTLYLVLSCAPMTASQQYTGMPSQLVMVPTPMYGTPYYPSIPAAVPYQPAQVIPSQGSQRPIQQPPQIKEEDLNQVSEMFPNVEKEVIKSVMEANRGNKDATINSLLSMNSM